MIAPVFSQGTRARTCSLKTEAWSVGTSMQNQLCRHLRCTHRHCFSMVTRLRSFQNQTCNSSYNGQSAPQHCWQILNLGAFISCWCVVQQEKENISAGVLELIVSLYVMLTSAERRKLTPMFNLSSKYAATTPFESILPLRRHCNRSYFRKTMWKELSQNRGR